MKIREKINSMQNINIFVHSHYKLKGVQLSNVGLWTIKHTQKPLESKTHERVQIVQKRCSQLQFTAM